MIVTASTVDATNVKSDQTKSSLPDGFASQIVCVDLDGTLIVGDLLWEAFAKLIREAPFRALLTLVALLRGRAYFKQRVAEQVTLDPSTLTYRTELLNLLTKISREGAHLVLVTASDRAYATAVADHVKIFRDVISSDGSTNLKGRQKAQQLVERFGEGRFHYVANDWADVPVWQVAAGATAVAPSPSLRKYLTAQYPGIAVLAPRPHPVKSFVRAMRPHQWAKNALVFVPVVAAHQILRIDLMMTAFLTFLAFNLCASAIYLVNDVFDAPADRLHPRKNTRPFAAGELTLPQGLIGAAALLLASMIFAATAISAALVAVLAVYVAVTTAYSVKFKRVPVVDVFTLTALYVIRIIAGGVATGTPLSSWFLAFGLFLFLSLAFVKRYVELLTTNGLMPGREYRSDDALWMHAIGTSAGYMAVLILALYITAPEVMALYARPRVLWPLCPLLLFWLTRLWFRAGRRLVHDDPVVETLRDPMGYFLLGIASVIVTAAAL
jgi:4-hydroxybenzoate polyprenyltransferase